LFGKGDAVVYFVRLDSCL